MESNCNDKIVGISQELIVLLKTNDENRWSVIIGKLRDDYIAAEDKAAAAKQFILILRGGMGSFLDFVLHKNRKPLVDENNKLDDLRHKLYNECNKII